MLILKKNKLLDKKIFTIFRSKLCLYLPRVQSLYNTPHYNTDNDRTRSCCSFFTAKELKENDHKMVSFLYSLL